jgi:hypothetical protein
MGGPPMPRKFSDVIGLEARSVAPLHVDSKLKILLSGPRRICGRKWRRYVHDNVESDALFPSLQQP